MSNYPNMSYCMCENTSLAMNQILNAMSENERDFLADMSREERMAFDHLIEQCKTFIEAAEAITDDASEDSPWVDE
jgi:hypothetical protein